MSLSFHHSIKHNQKSERIRHLIVFDVESHIDKKQGNKTIFEPFLWSAIRSRYNDKSSKWVSKKYHGTDIDEFWDMIESYCYNKEKVVLSSHHLEPDFVPLMGIKKLQARDWIMTKYITHNKILFFEFSKDKKKLVITNSGNIFPGSIERWGKALGIAKLEMPTCKCLCDKWIIYCMRDCEILLQMWLEYFKFLDIHDMGNFKFTAASQAMTTYRHRFMTKTIAIHNHPATLILERNAYHGGRFQAMQIGKIPSAPFWRLDINSMYGEIMSTEELPYELRGYQDGCNLDKLNWLMKRYAVIAELTIISDEPFFPIVENDKVKYPVGRYKGVFCTPEIAYLQANHSILKVHRISWYKKAPILSEYAKYFLGIRQGYKADGNKPYEELAKLFVNSLYGKFGQYGYDDKIIGDCDPKIIKYEESFNADTHKSTQYLLYGGKVHVTEKKNNSYNTFVAIAAHITAYGRIRLWLLIKQAGIMNVYHVATDSLIVNAEGLDRLANQIDKMTLGKLKIEEQIPSLTIKAPNDMVLGDVEKIKGISKKAPKVKENEYIITCWTRFNTLFKKGTLDYYYTTTVHKHLKREKFNSLDKDGNHVTVFCEYENIGV